VPLNPQGKKEGRKKTSRGGKKKAQKGGESKIVRCSPNSREGGRSAKEGGFKFQVKEKDRSRCLEGEEDR